MTEEKAKHPDLSDVLSGIAIVISVAAAIFTYQDYRLNKDLAHLHMIPAISTYFDQPANGNPLVVIQNSGDIPVVSLSVKHRVLVYDRKLRAIALFVNANQLFSDKMTFKDVLKPMERINESLIKIGPTTDVVAMYLFDIKSYRESDMKEYDSQELFFVDGGKAYTHKEYSTHPDYRSLMTALTLIKQPSMTVGQGSVAESMKVIEGKKE